MRNLSWSAFHKSEGTSWQRNANVTITTITRLMRSIVVNRSACPEHALIFIPRIHARWCAQIRSSIRYSARLTISHSVIIRLLRNLKRPLAAAARPAITLKKRQRNSAGCGTRTHAVAGVRLPSGGILRNSYLSLTLYRSTIEAKLPSISIKLLQYIMV